VPLKLTTFAVLLALGTWAAAAQDLATLFPDYVQAKAARLLEAVDQASRAVESRRAAAYRAELAAETEAVQAYALLAASRSGHGPWASPDGSAKSPDAPAAMPAARARAKSAALSLASGEDGSAPYLKAREAAAQSLSTLIRSSGMSARSAASLERRLAAKTRAAGIFPETVEIAELLRKAGVAGAREAAAAASMGSAEETALALIASRDKIVALSPGTEAPLTRMEAACSAYRAWIKAFPYAAYPGGLAQDSGPDLATVSLGIVAFVSLDAARVSTLLEAMGKGDGRELGASRAARALAELWLRSPEPRRRTLAALYGLPESTLARFCFVLAPREREHPSTPTIDSIVCLRLLNGLASKLAEEAEHKGEGSGAEASLLLLERPELTSIARGESRYANLYAEASGRLEAIFAQSAEDASAKIETDASLIGAATRALGAAPTGLVVRSVNLRSSQEGGGRMIAFMATAADAAGNSINLPVDPVTAGKAYASAFARASGLAASRIDSISLLTKYGQRVVSAYDPENDDDSLEIGVFPPSRDSVGIGSIELELAMLGGWRP
jgi:hypothetical protein